MRFEQINRRHFLQGLGCSLALPFLPSLSARAQTVPFAGPKYFFALGSMHGGVPIEDWAPIDLPMTEVQLYNGNPAQGFDHRMRRGTLSSMTRANAHTYNPSGAPELSRVLGSFLNPYLDKLTILSGLDIMFYIAHQQGGNLGNFHAMDNNGNNRSSLQLPSMPTIDRVIAQSPNFYGPGDPFTVRSINFNPGSGIRISHDGPIGAVNPTPFTSTSPFGLFDAIFGDVGAPSSPSDPRLSIIDRVLGDYNRVMNSPSAEGNRISNSDRNRLDEFITGLRDTEQKFEGLANAQSCEDVQAPDSGTSVWNSDRDHDVARPKIQAYLDVIVAAFKCGRCRVATTGMNRLMDDYAGNWHQDIAHRGRSDLWLDYTIRHHRFIAEQVFGYVVEQLDVSIDGVNPTTYLDNSIVVWNHESGQETHKAVGLPTIVAGSCGGFLQTGELVDYRNLSSNAVTHLRADLAHESYPGIPYNRWLHTVLEAYDIPDLEYKVGALGGMQGYGDPYVENDGRFNQTKYGPNVLNDMDTILNEIVA